MSAQKVSLAGGYQFERGRLLRDNTEVPVEVTPLSASKVNILSRSRKKPAVVGGKKFCPRCEGIYPQTAEFFQRDRHTADGLTSWCKSCRSEGRKASYWANPELGRQRTGPAYRKRREGVA